jgi:calcineurin-like phosphoesterase family protein
VYKILKFPWEKRNTHYWSSDWHIFHDPKWNIPIWMMRGYSSAKDAVSKTLAKINERVGPDDTLWYLGDMFLNATDEQCLNWISGLNCQNINVLLGNHESNMYRLYKQEVMRQFGRDDIEVYPLKMGKITFLGNHLEIQIGKKNIVMNHFPIHSWNGMGGRKSWMISGHQHNADKTRNPDAPINRVLDVGWDWKCDVWSFADIEDVMDTKTFVSYDHHVEDVH